MAPEQVEILLAEDNPEDAEMTLRAHLRKLVDDGSVHEEDEVYTAVGTVGR